MQAMHFNHTNPLLWNEAARSKLGAIGFRLPKKECIEVCLHIFKNIVL